jgi:cytoskeletal protein CcmA (bactofilin family)
MKTMYKFLSIFSLITILALTFATPAYAFDGRSGDNVVIKNGEVIEDDVYVGASTFVLDGTIKGDLVVFAETITINGTVEGNLIAAGQSIIINGTVTHAARIAGALLQIGKTATIGGDVIAGGASLEAQKGSAVKGDLVVGSAQTLLDGNITGDVKAGTGALELNGEVDGNVAAEVGEHEGNGPSPSMYMPNSKINFPTVKPGFTIAEGAKIKGNLDYTLSKDITIPVNAVDGKVTRNTPVVEPVKAQPTTAQKAMTWTFNLIRTIITLIIFGLFLGWLAPTFVKSLVEKVQTQAIPSLGWGLITYAAFFFAILVIIVAMVAGGILFGVLTLGGMSGTIIWLGILVIFAMILGFVLITAFLTKIVVAQLSGKLILARFKPTLAEHKVWPLVIGVVLIALLVAIPFIGWLFGVFIMFVGLGALWIWGRDFMQARKPV